jgi:hypothetical protein
VRLRYLIPAGDSRLGTNEFAIDFDTLPIREGRKTQKRGRPKTGDAMSPNYGGKNNGDIPANNGDILDENGDIAMSPEPSYSRHSINRQKKRLSLSRYPPGGEKNSAGNTGDDNTLTLLKPTIERAFWYYGIAFPENIDDFLKKAERVFKAALKKQGRESQFWAVMEYYCYLRKLDAMHILYAVDGILKKPQGWDFGDTDPADYTTEKFSARLNSKDAPAQSGARVTY